MLWYAKRSAVTFLDNHDTAGDLNDRFGSDKHLAQGYAFLLTHPGVPCVFWNDWAGPNRGVIATLAALRASAGVTRDSLWDVLHAGPGLYSAIIGGRLAVKLGSKEWSPNMGRARRVWERAASGDGWAVWARLPDDPPEGA